MIGNYTVSDSERARVSSVQQLGERGGSAITALLEMLTDVSWVVRRAVVESLAALGDVAVQPLCELLRTKRDSEARIAAAVDALVASRGEVDAAVLELALDSDPAIVADAAQILGRRKSAVAVPALVSLTNDASDVVAVAALEALGRIGGKAAVEALIETVGKGSFFRTFPSIDILGRSGDRRVVEPLANLLQNPNYLAEAARALGRTGERAAAKPLLTLFKSPIDSVVRIAAVALWELHVRFEEKSGTDAAEIEEILRKEVNADMVRRLARALSNGDLNEELAVCRLFGIIGGEESSAWLATRLDGPASVAECAAYSLKKIGKETDSHVLGAIRSGDSARRKVLLPVVTKSSAANDVALCLEDNDPVVRALTCDTLARLGNTTVVPAIFKMLLDANTLVVHAATSAIQALGSREARALAVSAAASPSAVVRRAALRVLAYFGDDSALAPILHALDDPDMRVREVAIQGLPYLEDPKAQAALLLLAKSADDRTRGLSMRAIGGLPKADERAYSILLKGLRDSDAWVKYYACQSLGRLYYAPAAQEIAALLKDPAGQVRVSAVEALSHLDSPGAHNALKEAASSPEPDVKRAAIVGLGIVHRKEDLQVVLAAAASEDVTMRLIALSALVNFLSPEVVPTLSAAAYDADEQVRSAAIGFLASRTEPAATESLVRLLGSAPAQERAKAALLLPNGGRVPGLLTAFATADDELATTLVSILARMQRPDACKGLLAVMKIPNVAARKAAVAVIGANRDPEREAILRDSAANDSDPGVRQICALLLAE